MKRGKERRSIMAFNSFVARFSVGGEGGRGGRSSTEGEPDRKGGRESSFQISFLQYHGGKEKEREGTLTGRGKKRR